jgi:membrane fusion protein (multidrug efflux system)
MSGVLEQLLVEEGDDVKAGQPLAILENDEQTIEFQRSAASRDNKIREYERAQKLREQDLLSEEDYDASRREAEEAGHAADLAELVLSRTVIRAPFDGTVLKRHLDDGGNVNDGTPVYDLADITPLYADVNIPERQIARLAVDQAVHLIADSSGEKVEARIERLAPEVDPATGTVKVTLAVRGSTALRPGGFVRVEIVVDTHFDALVVPRSALVAEGRRWHVFRLAAEGSSVERLEIVRGFEEGDRVEIVDVVSGGEALEPGDRIVVVGASALSEGSIVDVLEQETEEADRDEDPGVAT